MPKNYKKPRYLYFLSEHDELVPDGYLPLAQIFTDPKCTLPNYTPDEWCIGETALQKMRKETYEEVRKRFRITKAERFDRYWNSNLAAINTLGLNQFERLPCFSNLADVMVAFQSLVDTQAGKKKNVISFGVKKTLYRKYYDHVQEAVQNGVEPCRITLRDSKIKNNGNIIASTQRTYIAFTGKDECGKRIPLEKNEIYNSFSEWCKLQGITKKQGVYSAMMLIMSQNPIEGMQDIKAYKRETDIGLEEILIDTGIEDMGNMNVKIENSIINTIDAVINRFNRDVENCDKKRLTKSMLIKNAVMYYLQHLPLKYTDPQAYREYMEAKKMEEYNRKFINRL